MAEKSTRDKTACKIHCWWRGSRLGPSQYIRMTQVARQCPRNHFHVWEVSKGHDSLARQSVRAVTIFEDQKVAKISAWSKIACLKDHKWRGSRRGPRYYKRNDSSGEAMCEKSI